MVMVRVLIGAASLVLGACAAAPEGGDAATSPPASASASSSESAPAGASASATRDRVDQLTRPPADFTLDVAIIKGPRTPDFTEAHLRQGHFILLPDGSLHHDSGRFVMWGQRPGRTRALYQQQVSDLWTIARSLGFTLPSNANFDGNPVLLEPGRGQILYIIAFAAAGERWTFVRRISEEVPPDPASVTLIRTLCDLAWSKDESDERFLPVRYDFGPDPYAGFRRVN